MFPLYSEAMPTRLQCLDVPVVDDTACERAYPGMISRRMMCAGHMDGGRDACNVNYYFPFFFHLELQLFCCEVFDETPPATSQSYLPLLVRVTPAAPWCALERSTAWCHGVKDVRSPATPGSTSRCVSSSTGSTTSSRQTPEEVSRFSFTANLTLPPPASSKTTSSLPSLWRHRQTHEPECRQQNKHLLVHPLFFYYLSFHFFERKTTTCLTKQYTRSLCIEEELSVIYLFKSILKTIIKLGAIYYIT